MTQGVHETDPQEPKICHNLNLDGGCGTYLLAVLFTAAPHETEKTQVSSRLQPENTRTEMIKPSVCLPVSPVMGARRRPEAKKRLIMFFCKRLFSLFVPTACTGVANLCTLHPCSGFGSLGEFGHTNASPTPLNHAARREYFVALPYRT